MAITPPQNDVFLREVDEELRRDQMIDFGRRYGRWVAVGVVLFLVALGGMLWWRHHKQVVAGEQGEQFQTALASLGDGNLKEADPALAKLATSGHPGYRVMAQFTQADLSLKNNDLKGAAAKFAAIAGDADVAQPFRDLALIRQTSAEYDTLSPDTIVSRLQPLAVKGNPWFASAGEMVAMAQLQQNKRDQAAKMFGAIAADEGTPESVRQRAVQMAASLSADADRQTKDKAGK